MSRIREEGKREKPMKAREPFVPSDPVKAFAYLVSKCSSGLLVELMDEGKTKKEARNAIIHYFLDFAAGEACRIAREEGREPNHDKWITVTNGAFESAVKRTLSHTQDK